jgi:recombination protein RecT
MSTVATTPPNGKQALSIRQWLQSEQMAGEIAKALPKHMSPERMMRVAMTCLTKVPKLAECTPESFMQCLLSLSQWGLEPDGRRAHLIPYGKECTLIIDYKGLIELAYRSGVVKTIHADVVYQGDIFAYSLGEIRDHTPWAFRVDAAKPKEQGKVIAAYARIVMTGDVTKCEVMTAEEVESIRMRSKAGQSGPWKSDWSEMAKKTAFRRASKWLPLSAEIQDAFDKDGDALPPIQHKRIEASDNRIAELLAGPSDDALANSEQDK